MLAQIYGFLIRPNMISIPFYLKIRNMHFINIWVLVLNASIYTDADT